MLPYLDIHTHRTDDSDSAVYNLKLEEIKDIIDNLVIISPISTYSAGLHPWDVDKEAMQEQLALVDRAAGQDQVRLIGECGLDKLRGPEIEVQKEAFAVQIKLANQHQKPLIIHCVKAYDELIDITKAHPPQIPAIIHGFNKSTELARQLRSHGFLLSFGAALLNKHSPARTALQECWQQQHPFFLETDNSPQTITEIHAQAAILLKISEDALKDAIFANWKKIGLKHA